MTIIQDARNSNCSAPAAGKANALGGCSVLPYEDDLGAAWDEYVLEHPEGTPFHLTAWKRVIERAFGFESRYLIASDNGAICGVLPLFLTSSWIQGRTLISSPFAVYGSICSSTETSRHALCMAAREMADRESVEYLELREAGESFRDGFDYFLAKDLYVTFDCELDKDPEVQLRRLPKDTRYMIRKAQRNGLRLVTDNSQLASFCEIYARSAQHLGTPVFGRSYFRTLLEESALNTEISVVWQGQRAVAAVLSFRFRDSLLPYYGGSLPEARSLGANNFMYWELMKESCERGLRHFDFGRSKLNTGSHFFKTQWGMRERPLPYQYYLVRRKTLPNFSPANPRFQLATKVWQHIPFPLAKILAPPLVRLFP
jgi:FemAB-related protein (PEP-CTERM system-associated)